MKMKNMGNTSDVIVMFELYKLRNKHVEGDAFCDVNFATLNVLVFACHCFFVVLRFCA